MQLQGSWRGRARGVVGGLVAAVALGVCASSASAGSTVICTYPYQTGSYGDCPPGARHTLTQVTTHSDYGSCSGAWVTYPNDFYAGYACQGNDSSHPYNAGNLLYGASHSSVSFVNFLGGIEYW
jgi:hypothetical protein